jgi:signal transduction histidine kinase
MGLPEAGGEVGFEIDEAESAEAALEKIAAVRPQIVLLDHRLPGMSGTELLDKLELTADGDLLVIMITAYASLETAVAAAKRGAYDFLAKPFTPDELRSVVRKAAGRLLLQRQARRLAEEKRRVRFEFVRVLAHELKSPLGAIEGYLNICADPAMHVSDDQRRGMIARSIERLAGMRQLINDLLDLTRLESGEKKRELAALDLAAVARECIENVLPQAAARGIAVALTGAAPLEIQADRGELAIIVNNLVSNAVKYNRDGGRVEVRLSRVAGGVELAVSDTGIGMTEEETRKLFGEFVRMKNARTRGIPGSGLGLSILRKLVDLYRGEVSVKSVPGEGSTFTVLLREVEPAAGGGKQ